MCMQDPYRALISSSGVRTRISFVSSLTLWRTPTPSVSLAALLSPTSILVSHSPRSMPGGRSEDSLSFLDSRWPMGEERMTSLFASSDRTLALAKYAANRAAR